MLWLLIPCGSLRGKIARNVSTFNFNGPPVPPMVPNLSTPCCNCRYLTRSWKKLRVSWGPSGTRKRRHWSRKLPIVWFLNSWNPQEPLRQSVPETRSPHFFEAFLVSFIQKRYEGWKIQNTGDEAAQAREATQRGAGEAPQLPAAEADPRMAKWEEPGEPPRNDLTKKNPMKLSWNWLF